MFNKSQEEQERLVRLTMEYDSGKTIVLEGKALEKWETAYNQGLAAMLQVAFLKKQIGMLRQQKEMPSSAPAWGRPLVPAPEPSGTTVEGEPLMTLKQVIGDKSDETK